MVLIQSRVRNSNHFARTVEREGGVAGNIRHASNGPCHGVVRHHWCRRFNPHHTTITDQVQQQVIATCVVHGEATEPSITPCIICAVSNSISSKGFVPSNGQIRSWDDGQGVNLIPSFVKHGRKPPSWLLMTDPPDQFADLKTIDGQCWRRWQTNQPCCVMQNVQHFQTVIFSELFHDITVGCMKLNDGQSSGQPVVLTIKAFGNLRPFSKKWVKRTRCQMDRACRVGDVASQHLRLGE